jgi:hypothetical protein
MERVVELLARQQLGAAQAAGDLYDSAGRNNLIGGDRKPRLFEDRHSIA